MEGVDKEWTQGGENSALRLQAINTEPQSRAQQGTHTQLVRNRGLLGPSPAQTKGEQTNPSQVLPSKPE